MRPKFVFWIFAFVAFLLTVGLAALVIGAHDAALAHASLGTAAGSALLVVLGVILLVAAWDLVHVGLRRSWAHGRRPPCKLTVLVGFFLTLLLGAYVFFSALKTRTPQQPLVVIVALIFVALALLGLHIFARDARLTIPRLGTVAIGLVGTIIGASEFWYQSQYAPSRVASAIVLKVDLHRTAHKNGLDVIRATIDYTDVGGRSLSVIGSTYTLTGSHVIGRCRKEIPGQSPLSVKAADLLGFFNHALLDPQRSRYMADAREQQPADLLAAGKFVADGKRLDPGVTSRRDFIFFVPHRYQLLRYRVQLSAIPASFALSQTQGPIFKTFPADHELYGYWHIDDRSWLHDLLYGRNRWVVWRYDLVNPQNPKTTNATPDLHVTVRFPDPSWSEGLPGQTQAEDLFRPPGNNQDSTTTQPADLSEPFAATELPLKPLAKPRCP